MTDSGVESLILDLLEWLAKQDRSYEEVMDAWRTSCPKLPVWEDANDRGLVMLDVHHGRSVVRLTSAGVTLLEQHRGSREMLDSRHDELQSGRVKPLDGEEAFAALRRKSEARPSRS